MTNADKYGIIEDIRTKQKIKRKVKIMKIKTTNWLLKDKFAGQDVTILCKGSNWNTTFTVNTNDVTIEADSVIANNPIVRRVGMIDKGHTVAKAIIGTKGIIKIS